MFFSHSEHTLHGYDKVKIKNRTTFRLFFYKNNLNENVIPHRSLYYKDKKGNAKVELIEIKPSTQAMKENIGKNSHNQASYVLNMAKWEAAYKYAKSKGIKFRVITEKELFHQGRRKG